MKGITFAVAFILTVCVVIGGVALYPNILGQAATYNNDFIFGFFLGPFFVLLFFAWIGEKVVLKIRRKKIID
jgi:apolipoprotein N-acyltransferase